MEKIKARSRLQKKPAPALSRLHSAKTNLPQLAKPTKLVKPKSMGFMLPKVNLLAYWRYIVCLLIAALAYYGLFLLINKVYPSQIQHFLWTNSYLPFFALFFLGNFFLLTFLFLDKKIGFYLSLWLNLLLYLKISQIKFDFYGIIFLVLLAAILLLPDIIKKYVKHK